MKTRAELVYHHAHMLDTSLSLSDVDRQCLRAARHFINIALGERPDRGEFDNAADAEAIKHESE